MSGGYRSNPYFDGVISAITTQGEVTANVRGDRWEIEERRKNASSSRQEGTYPGGELFDNQHVYPHELVMGWTRKKARFNFPGEPNEIGFSSQNGIWYEEFDTDDELMDNLYLIGLAKTPFKFDSLDQLQHGFTAIRVGSGSTFHTGDKPIFSGDLIEWSVVPRPSTVDPNLPVAFEGGEYGGNPDPRFGSSYNAGGRQGYPRVGTPHGKFRFIVNPVVRGNMKPGMNGAISMMKKRAVEGGVSDIPVETILHRGRKMEGVKRPTPYQEYALSTLVTDVVGALRVIEVLMKRNKLRYVDDAGAPDADGQSTRVLDLLNDIGLFANGDRPTALLESIIDSLYMGFSANASSSIAKTAELRRDFATAFSTRGNIKEGTTRDIRYVKIVLDYANIRQGSYDRAVGHKTRRIIGTALGPSTKGQRLDILLGHFRGY